jgi:hypothetical protein
MSFSLEVKHVMNRRADEWVPGIRGRESEREGGTDRMEVNTQIGETAGKIWQLLSEGGPLTLAQMRRRLNGSTDLLHLALGWLAREDKVMVSQERRSLRVRLR